MKLTLLDEGVPSGLGSLLGRHAKHVHDMGWDDLPDVAMIRNAVQAGFEVLVTTDRSIRYQQNLGGLALALVVLHTTDWRKIKVEAETIAEAIEAAKVGSHQDCLVGPRRGRRR